MTYTPTTWVNSTAPPINATNLNKLEQGMIDAHAAALYARYLWTPPLGFPRANQAFTVGRVYLTPIDVRWPITIDRIIYQVGTTSLGNVRVGLYREGTTADSPAGAALVVESASVAQSAINCIQMVTVASTVLTRGQYFVAIQADAIGSMYADTDAGSSLAFYYPLVYAAFTDPCPALPPLVVNTVNAVLGFRIASNQPVI